MMTGRMVDESAEPTTAPETTPGPPSLWETSGPVRGVVLALLVAAATALAVGLSLPVVYMRRGLSKETYSVLTGIVDLAHGGNVLLAGIVFVFSVVFPIAKLAALFVLLFGPLERPRLAGILRSLSPLGRWSMLDVFVIAILVGSIRLGILSESEPRGGIYVFGAAIVLSMVATMALERLARAGAARRRIELRRGGAGPWLSLASLVLFLVGLSQPLMRVEKWQIWENEYSVLTASLAMARSGEALLGAIVLLFVVLLPLARFGALVVLRWRTPSARFTRALLLVEKWAMLDVFGLALLIVLVKIGDVATVESRPGFWILLAAVALSLGDSVWLAREERRAAG